jgi:hypothetical protein
MVRIRGLSAKNILLYVPRPVARGLCTPSCASLPPAELEAAPKKRSSKKNLRRDPDACPPGVKFAPPGANSWLRACTYLLQYCL